MERLKRVLKLIFRNLYYYRVDYIRTFVILRVVQAFLIVPSIGLIIRIIMDVTGIRTITENNILLLLSHPITVVGLVIIVLIGILFIYYEMGFLMLLAYHQQRAIPYTWKGLVKRLNQKVVYFLSLQTFLLAGYLLLIIPLISTVLPVSLIQNFAVPRFIVDELLNSRSGTYFYLIMLAILGFIGLRFIFTWPFFTVYQWSSIYEALKMSWKFSQRKLLETIGMLAFILVTHLTLLFVVLTLIFIPLSIIEKTLPILSLLAASFTLTLAEGVVIVFFAILQVIFSQLLVMVAFKLTHDKPLIIQQEPFRETFRQWTVLLVLFAFFLISGFNFINLERFGYASNTAVIAHRGFMDKGVENTISSIVESNKVGAEIVEIDVQQTKDGQFVVFHDETLSRLSLRSGIIHQMTLAELTDITVFDKGLHDKIPSLQQVLDVSQKLNIKLLIELKTHGYETDDMLEQLVALIDQYDALDVHYIQSPDFLQMEELEAIEPRIHTGIVFAIAFGELPKTTVDFVSIEQSFASPAIQKQAQKAGKELFVWTVNEEKDIQHFFEQNIDGMITDHPDVALQNRLLFSEQINFVRKLLNKINIIY